MYGLHRTVNRFINNCNITKQIVRNKRLFARKKPPASKLIDAGIEKRKALYDDIKEFQDLTDYEFDLEADFMSVGSSHKEYEREKVHLQERNRHLIVKQKYFKEKLPNFLTWSDKEQIRHLHRTNPEEWTLEKLSEGFPALPQVISKITKSAWTKKDGSKIENHDESVKRNWALFKEGKFPELPSEVSEHLKKFTDRDLNYKPFEISGINTLQKSGVSPNIKIGNEFSSIITRYQNIKNKSKSNNERAIVGKEKKLEKPPKEDTYVIGGMNLKRSQHVTLDILEQRQGKKDLALEKVEVEDGKQNTIELNFNLDKHVVANKFKSSELSTDVKKGVPPHCIEYPEQIRIPKDKFKRGYIYKLNDCYYHDDGSFLYRVPGMY